MSIKSLAEYPDVQAWIDFLNRRHARIIESRRGLEAKMPAGEMERLKDNGFPEVCPAKELAAAMLLREGHVIACQTDTAAAVLTLGPSCGSDVFRAKAAVCGDGPLAKGDQLHRTVIPDQFYAPDRKPRHQIIGTIVEVG